MRAVVYCRVSDPRQVQNLSLQTQEEVCRDFCHRHGYDVSAVFVDDGESAKTTDRPEFLRLLTHCRQQRGQLHAVVVYALTRFSRNAADHHAIATLLRGMGIMLRSATEPIDESPSGRLMEGILASMAQFDNDQKSARVKAGMQSALERGRWMWRAPIGYRRGNPKAGEPSLIPDPDRAPLIVRAFQAVADGRLTGRGLQAWLAEHGLWTERGVPVKRRALYELLHNPVYCGQIVPSRGRAYRGDFAPLISEALFAQVRRRLSAKGQAIASATRHRNHPDFPLRRFVRCADCGKPLTAGWSKGTTKRYGFYRCTTGCTSVSRERLERAFLDVLDALRPVTEYRRAFEHHVLRAWRAAHTEATTTRDRLLGQIRVLERRLSTIDELFVDRRIDDQTYRAQRDRTREELTVLRLQRHDAEQVEVEVEGQLAFALQALSQASLLWTSANTAEERQEIQAVFFPEGLIWKSVPYDSSKTRRGSRSRDGGFVELRNCCSCFELGALTRDANGLVRPTAPTWNSIVAFLAHMQRLQKVA